MSLLFCLISPQLSLLSDDRRLFRHRGTNNYKERLDRRRINKESNKLLSPFTFFPLEGFPAGLRAMAQFTNKAKTFTGQKFHLLWGPTDETFRKISTQIPGFAVDVTLLYK